MSESLERLYREIEVNYDMKITSPELVDRFFRMLGFTDEVTDNGDGTYTHTFRPPPVFHDYPGSCPKCGSVGGCPTSCPNFYDEH